MSLQEDLCRRLIYDRVILSNYGHGGPNIGPPVFDHLDPPADPSHYLPTCVYRITPDNTRTFAIERLRCLMVKNDAVATLQPLLTHHLPPGEKVERIRYTISAYFGVWTPEGPWFIIQHPSLGPTTDVFKIQTSYSIPPHVNLYSWDNCPINVVCAWSNAIRSEWQEEGNFSARRSHASFNKAC